MPTDSRRAQRPLSLREPAIKASHRKTTLALGVSALMLSPAVLAQEEETIELDTLQIEDRTIDTNPYAEPGAPYKAKVSGDQRHVKPLAETPQTINVLTETQIQESGRTDLKEILQAQPGITIGTGENGNAFGDRYIIRGHEARSDVFVDGLRDPGMTTRESFATEQVEITKGPSSTFGGRGTTGGAVNSITKQASTEYNFTELSGGIGTDNYYRATVDSNQVLSDTVALRANLLQTAEDVPDRAPADRERTGAALSASFQATDKLDIVADYYYLNAEDRPDLGTYIMPDGGKPVADIPVYSQDSDFQNSEINTFTLRAGYQFNDQFRVHNALRYGTTDNGYVTTGARGGYRDSTDPEAPGAYTVTLSSRPHQGWQEVEYFVDQLNFYFDTIEASGIAHSFIFGLEYSDYKVLNGVYDYNQNGATNCIVNGRRGASAGYCIMDASGNWVSDATNLTQRDIQKGDWDSSWEVETVSASIMDTIDFSDVFSMFLGIRYDLFDYSLNIKGNNPVPDIRYDDGIWNGHAGLVYDVTENGNVYLTWSSATNISGGESDVGNNCGYGGFCGLGSPEDVTNWELGTKWNLFEEKLLATFALFQIEKDNVMEGRGYGFADASSNTGANRVRGIEASFVGNITDKLSGQFGVAVMDSEVLESETAENIGRALSNFAENSANLQLRYQLLDQFAFGGTATYKSEMYAGQPDSAAGWSGNGYSFTVPSYTVFDVFAVYDVTDNLNARLNVTNVTDKDYYLAAYRSGSFTYMGDARRAVLTLTYQM